MIWQPQFCKFRTNWNVFKRITNLPDNQIHAQLYNACGETVQNNLVNTTTNFFFLTEHDLLNTLEAIVTKKSNPAVHQWTFSPLFQSEGESVTDFVVRLKPISPDCKFSCPGCHKDLQPIHIKDQLILGLYNEKLQTDILAEVSHLIQLEDIIKHYEAYESAQHNQWPLHKSTEASIAHISLYQQGKFFPTQPLAKQANKSKSTRPCPSCGSQSHDQRGSNDCPTKCPAWGKFCNHCKIPHHFASVCQRKPSESASALITQIYYDSQSDACHTISLIQDINEIPALICSTKSNHCNCNPVLINIFPDSGASICLAGPHHLQQLNLKWEDLICCHKEVKAVGGSYELYYWQTYYNPRSIFLRQSRLFLFQ